MGVYVNALGLDDGDDRVRSAYGANYERLVALKNTSVDEVVRLLSCMSVGARQKDRGR